MRRSEIQWGWERNGRYCYGRSHWWESSRTGRSSEFGGNICSAARKLSSSKSCHFGRVGCSCRWGERRRLRCIRSILRKINSWQWSAARKSCAGVDWQISRTHRVVAGFHRHFPPLFRRLHFWFSSHYFVHGPASYQRYQSHEDHYFPAIPPGRMLTSPLRNHPWCLSVFFSFSIYWTF